MSISECCGAKDGESVEDGPAWSDIGICPECRDHCEFVEEKEEEVEYEWEYAHCNWHKVPKYKEDK
jgi:hypothetical protein